MLASGEVVQISKTHFPDLFRATCGGMGLTGIILGARIQLKPIQSSRIIQNTYKADCLEAVCEKFEENIQSTYSVRLKPNIQMKIFTLVPELNLDTFRQVASPRQKCPYGFILAPHRHCLIRKV